MLAFSLIPFFIIPIFAVEQTEEIVGYLLIDKCPPPEPPYDSDCFHDDVYLYTNHEKNNRGDFRLILDFDDKILEEYGHEFNETQVRIIGIVDEIDSDIILIKSIFPALSTNTKLSDLESDVANPSLPHNKIYCPVEPIKFFSEYFSWIDNRPDLSDNKSSYYLEHINSYLDYCQLEGFDIPPPTKLLKVGMRINDIQCSKDLILIQKSSRDSIACVKDSTAEKLIERGWTNLSKSKYQNDTTQQLTTWIGIIPTQCSNAWDEYRFKLINENKTLFQDPLSYEERVEKEALLVQEFYEQQGAKIFDKKIVFDVVKGDHCEGCSCNSGGHGIYFLVSNDSLDLFDRWYKFEDGVDKYSGDSVWFFIPKPTFSECGNDEPPNCQSVRYYDKKCEMTGILLDEFGEPIHGLIKGAYQDKVSVDYSACDLIDQSVSLSTDKNEYHIDEPITFYIKNEGNVPVMIFWDNEGLEISANGIYVGHTGNPFQIQKILNSGEQVELTWEQVIWPNRIIGDPLETPEYITDPSSDWRYTKPITYDLSVEYLNQKISAAHIPVKIVEGYQWNFAINQGK